MADVLTLEQVLRSPASYRRSSPRRWLGDERAGQPAPTDTLGFPRRHRGQLRQLRRTRPLEVEEHAVPGGASVQVPTLPEMLRVKSYLVVQRNAALDHLDTAALADRLGADEAVAVLSHIDDYHQDRSGQHDSVLTALVERFAEPAPCDPRVTTQLRSYEQLDPRWHSWSSVTDMCQRLADMLLRTVEERSP